MSEDNGKEEAKPEVAAVTAAVAANQEGVDDEDVPMTFPQKVRASEKC